MQDNDRSFEGGWNKELHYLMQSKVRYVFAFEDIKSSKFYRLNSSPEHRKRFEQIVTTQSTKRDILFYECSAIELPIFSFQECRKDDGGEDFRAARGEGEGGG
ncbi:hypothetical protein TNCT_3591 [Trichonephila clavata]|uniref:Uncharacterized protein n=1 Tax=Trichonephila clavata TaxID=2740835 RepID=A0A8X6JHE5_TRICU|nr:hypothetical protein TNCT_3591 [Trichonephila clavata]